MTRLKLTEPQASIVEIHVLDSAHDDERQPWWPKLDGIFLAFEPAHAAAIAELFFDASNSEENEPRFSKVAFNLARKIRAVSP